MLYPYLSDVFAAIKLYSAISRKGKTVLSWMNIVNIVKLDELDPLNDILNSVEI